MKCISAVSTILSITDESVIEERDTQYGVTSEEIKASENHGFLAYITFHHNRFSLHTMKVMVMAQIIHQ